MLFQMRQLSSDHTGDHVAHAVVITHFFMLVPRSPFSGLGRPLAGLFRSFLAVSQKHPSGAAGDDFITVEGNSIESAEGPSLDAFV